MKTLTLVDRAASGYSLFSLPGSATQVGVVSPYFQRSSLQKVGNPGRDIRLSLLLMAVNRAVIRDIEDGGSPNYLAYVSYLDGTTGAVVDTDIVFFSPAGFNGPDDYLAAITSAVNTNATGHGYTLSAGVVFEMLSTAQVNALIAAALPVAPVSYQTIVSQTGTAAPAVSGGLAPVSTYAGGPTFTWARTSTGVYTLTASSGVFNTSGKTSVFITPPQNLNGSFKAVVTSSTVITITTAVQSLAVLGLLGFTATPTDALLTQTMIYVQTYA